MSLVKQTFGGFIDNDDPGEPGYATPRTRISVTEDEAELLKGWARGKRVLEIGTGLGVSSKAMAETAKHIVSVDIDPWVERHVSKDVEWHCGMQGFDGEFDMFFIDGCHTCEAVLKDIDDCKARAAHGATIVFHDASYPPVMEAIEKRFVRHEYIESENGIAIVKV